VLTKLPGWAVDDDASVAEEVAEWRGLTPAQLWRLAALCARDAIWAAKVSGNAAKILEYEEPLPVSTVGALARLREGHRNRGDR
jgi:hypothetical protein